MKRAKILCGLLCLLVLASNVWSMSRWNEARGVYDDVCYLRQAHLFQRFGLEGFDTDISRDDDLYLTSKLKEIGFPAWSDPSKAPCHTAMPTTNKLVIQYPPGTGFVLALFSPGFQVIPLYVLATTVLFVFALLGLSYAHSISSVILTGTFGSLAVYLMINPAKASYSMAPTMVVCAFAGFLTAKLFIGSQRHRILLTMLLGFLIGLAVNFRLPNVFLSAGYFLFLLAAFARMRNRQALLQGASFAAAFLVGMAPTLLANAINAGSPFATTYGGADAVSPEFSLKIIFQYVADMQFVLLALAISWTGWILHARHGGGIRQIALVTAVNLLVNLAFFLSHPLFTPYYTVPIAMLSLWSLLFGSLMQPAEMVDEVGLERTAKA